METEQLFVTDIEGRVWSFDAATHEHGPNGDAYVVSRQPKHSGCYRPVLVLPLAQFARAEVGVMRATLSSRLS